MTSCPLAVYLKFLLSALILKTGLMTTANDPVDFAHFLTPLVIRACKLIVLTPLVIRACKLIILTSLVIRAGKLIVLTPLVIRAGKLIVLTPLVIRAGKLIVLTPLVIRAAAKSHVEPPCIDKVSNCKDYGLDICTGTYKGWAQDNCRQFCGYCGLLYTNTITGYFGKCFYNGQSYNQGESWSDGCKYDCTCDDASRGMYSCYNKCPVYYNLPPQCTLVTDSNNCCLQPVCNFKPTYSTTNGQSLGILNGVNVCVYQGQKYYQGQTWQDGCEYNCVCQDGNIGMYTCASVCGSFSNLPLYCHLEKQPGKCCLEPQCDFSKQYGQFSGVGTLSGGGSALSNPPTLPPCVDKDPQCARYRKESCDDPAYSQWSLEQCRKFCGKCNAMSAPGPNDKCLYKGQQYNQGAIWEDGCDLECVCENAHVGFFRCHKKCPTYINLPLGCTESQVSAECCPTIKCNGFVGTFTGSQTQPGTIGGYPVPNIMPTAVPTPMPGQTFAPGMIPTAAPPLTAKSIDGCLYKGVLYNQGMRWNDGCDYSCICEDESTGRFRCTAKCPLFGNLGRECQMKSNPSDPCCEYPECTPVNGFLTVVPVPTYGQGFSGYGKPTFPSGYGVMGPMGPSGQNPTPGATSGGFTGMVNPNPGQVITGSGHAGCVFHGVPYTKGQTWDDGCDYRCECLDDVSGSYRCNDRSDRRRWIESESEDDCWEQMERVREIELRGLFGNRWRE
ncbi:hypothetical protein CHS0354_040318 [Potamilus streckersoni]|uniref:VWFC domain-containing protein n=1 Tax=Potamilus streckersoni TaxID=2493646 RepID=A0AAE0SGA5_9BIVA|nr:hypothetical protein CHS0354_040318 [Potamilus streckersoni]